MSEEKTSKFGKRVLEVVIGICILAIVVQVGTALIGNWFKADKTMLKNTEKAQEDIGNALFLTFNDYGRLDVRYDYSVHAYISKKDYMLVPYPDRDKTITIVGKAWCENKGVILWYMPKVVLCDIQTGEDLGSYRCLRRLMSVR